MVLFRSAKICIDRKDNNMSYNLGRDEMFWRIGHEDSEQLIDDIRN